jgi:hypothetical protein
LGLQGADLPVNDGMRLRRMRCSLSWQPTAALLLQVWTWKLLISSYSRLERATCVNTHESKTCSRIAARRQSSETVRPTMQGSIGCTVHLLKHSPGKNQQPILSQQLAVFTISRQCCSIWNACYNKTNEHDAQAKASFQPPGTAPRLQQPTS